MANDMDMLIDIQALKQLKRYKEATVLEQLYNYKYSLGESTIKTKEQFEKVKDYYKKTYGFLDNYV